MPRLRALLDSLTAQQGADFEVIVVDDGSADGTAGALAEHRSRLDLRVIRHETARGPAAARNAGWRAAAAPLVAFVDDDCTASPGWVAALLAAHRRDPRAIVQGRTEEDPGELARSSVFWRSLHIDRLDPLFPTANIAYPRALLERIDGFDEGFPRPYGEDTDLAWRAQESGAPAVFAGDALIHHAVLQRGVVGLVRDASRFGDVVRVVKRHPAIRAELRHRVFWRPTHERVLGALAGAALARRTRGLSLLLAAPYALYYRRLHGGWPGTLASLPGYAAVDLAQVLALLRGSARYRTLVL
jgi:glycosyltransferase involved in cell wall biosynthesis